MSASDPSADDCLQPPNPAAADSFAHAPLACKRTLQRLRDFADGDLDAAAMRIVEHHVHECRACAVELARVEFETHRLRSAFRQAWASPSPRPWFVRRTLARALAQEPEVALQAEALREIVEAGADGQGPGATPRRLLARVMQQTAVELRAASAGGRRPADRWRVSLLLVVVASCLIAMASPFWRSIAEVTGVIRLSVVRSEQAWVDRDGSISGLSAGDGLNQGDALVLRAEGSIDAEYYDASITGEQPAANIRMRGDSELSVGLQLQLDHGSMEVLSHRPMEVLLRDGSVLELGAGLYRIEAAADPFHSDGLASTRVEVERGDGARIARASGAVGVVSVGQAGSYGRGAMGIAVDTVSGPSGDALLLVGSGRREVEEDPEVEIAGSVVDPFGSPLAHAAVRLTVPTTTGLVVRQLSTDHHGTYRTGTDGVLLESSVLVEVSPPGGRSDLGFLPVEAVPLRLLEGRTMLPVIELGAGIVVRGSVVGAAGQPLPYALALPVLYEESLGQVSPWGPGMSWADSSGRLEVRGLPGSLPTGRSLGLLVYHPDAECVFVPIPDASPGSVTEMTLRAPALVALRLSGLPASRHCSILEEVLGLPAGLAVRRHLVTSDANGIVGQLSCGRGRLWLEAGSSSHPLLHPIARMSSGVAEVGGEALDRRLALVPMQPVPGVAGHGLEIATQSRFQGAEPEPAAGEELVVRTSIGGLADRAQAFALRARAGGGSDARFLGLTRTERNLRINLHPGESELLVLGADGSFFRRDVLAVRGGSAQGRLSPITPEALGRAELSLVLAPVGDELRTAWTSLAVGAAGARPEIFRTLRRGDGFVAEGLPAGDYQVRDALQRTFRVRIQSGQTTTIR